MELHQKDPLDGDERADMRCNRDRSSPLDRCAAKSLCRIVALPSTEAPAGSVPCGVAAEHLRRDSERKQNGLETNAK